MEEEAEAEWAVSVGRSCVGDDTGRRGVVEVVGERVGLVWRLVPRGGGGVS